MTGALTATALAATNGVTAGTNVTATAGTFTGSPSIAVLQAAAASGQVAIRPNGGSTTGQTVFTSAGVVSVGASV
jgi:hypothetical protein